jgi:hypothetical protein
LALSTLTKAVGKIPSNLTLTDSVMIRAFALALAENPPYSV